MPAASTNERALEMVRQLRREGLDVARVVVEGRKIEIELANGKKAHTSNPADLIDMSQP